MTPKCAFKEGSSSDLIVSGPVTAPTVLKHPQV